MKVRGKQTRDRVQLETNKSSNRENIAKCCELFVFDFNMKVYELVERVASLHF